MSRSAASASRTLARTDSVPSGGRVRHFDQLSEAAQECLVAAGDGADPPQTLPPDLRSGDVVVFTDYYLVS